MSERVEARGSVQLGWPRGRPRRPSKVVDHAIEAIEALRPSFRPTLFQINLRLRGQRVGFDINLAAADAAGLKLSSQLLKLARIVRAANTEPAP